MPSQYKHRTVPDTTDPPDGPANFRSFTDSLWNTNLNHVNAGVQNRDSASFATWTTAANVTHAFPGGSLVSVCGGLEIVGSASFNVLISLVCGTHAVHQVQVQASPHMESYVLAGQSLAGPNKLVNLQVRSYGPPGSSVAVQNRYVSASALGI